jgi:glycine betaine/proline transport system substrate-binding protein
MIKKLFKQAVSGVALLCAATTFAAAAEPQSCTQVNMAGPGWTDIDATNAITGVLLKALGYHQNVANLSVPITYQGMKKGQIDVFLGNWMPAQAPVVKSFEDEKSIEVMHPNLSNAKFTLAVPDYVAAAGVHSFADLAKNADKFDSKIYGCAGQSEHQEDGRRQGVRARQLEARRIERDRHAHAGRARGA